MSEPPATPAARPRRRLSTRRRLVFGLVTCGLLLGVTEGFFQVREVVRARRKPRLPTEFCPYRDVRLIPGARYERLDQGRKMTINDLGLRGPEVGPKQPGTLRIACVGGSTTFGLYASDDGATWPARLEQRLREGGQAIEIVNAGAPGWTLRSSLTNLELTVFPLEPDLVICYHAYNDLMSNLEARYQADSRVDDVERLYRPKATRVLESSALYRFIRSRLRSPYDAFQEKQDRLDPEGIAAYRRNLERLVRRCAEQNARLVLCTYPSAFRPTLEGSQQAEVPALDQWYDALCPITYPRLVEGLARYNETIRAVAAEHGLPLVELERTFPKDVSFYKSPIHHSDPGEREVARRVAEVLLADGLVVPRQR